MLKKTHVFFPFLSLLLLFNTSCHNSSKAEEPDGGTDTRIHTNTGSGSGTDGDTGTNGGSDTKSHTDTDSDSKQIMIDPEDQWCEDSQECALVWTTCDLYSLAAVNELAREKYHDKYQEMCKDIQWEQPLFTATAKCMMDWQSDRRKCMLDGVAIESDVAGMCELSKDCVSVSSRCDFCECFGLPINSAYKEEASMLFSDVCRDYQNGVCDIFCEETLHLECLERHCTWTE